MGCGCGKAKAAVRIPSATGAPVAVAPAPVLMDVHAADGSLVASYSNPVTARAEARRVGGTVVPRSSTNAPSLVASATTETE